MKHRCGQEVTPDDLDKHACPGRIRPAGKTLAEAVGIEVPKNAPGGQKVFPSPSYGGQRSTNQLQVHNELNYEGFSDNDAWSRNA